MFKFVFDKKFKMKRVAPKIKMFCFVFTIGSTLSKIFKSSTILKNKYD